MQQKGYNRREFLKLGVFTAAFCAVQDAIASTAPTIDFEAVRKEYIQLYNYIKAKKDKLKPGETLTLIAAEDHSSANSSFLLPLMLASICRRLGIQNLALEEAADNDIFKAIKAASLKNDEQIKLKGDEFINSSTLQTLDLMLHGEASKVKFPEKHDPNIEGIPKLHELLWTTFDFLGFNIVAGDPKHDDALPLDISAPEAREKTIASLLERETAMVDVLETGDVVSFNGSLHAPALVDSLRAKGKNCIGINLRCGGEESAKLIEFIKTHPKESRFFTDRKKALNDYHTVNLPANPQLQPAQAYAMVALAAYEHMAMPDVKELSQTKRETLERGITNMLAKSGIIIPGFTQNLQR